MPIRGIRGATTVTADEPHLILQATRELLEEILAENEGMQPEDVSSAIFTVTDDLVSTFPAQAARQMGWDLVPMLCAREIPVPDQSAACDPRAGPLEYGSAARSESHMSICVRP